MRRARRSGAPDASSPGTSRSSQRGSSSPSRRAVGSSVSLPDISLSPGKQPSPSRRERPRPGRSLSKHVSAPSAQIRGANATQQEPHPLGKGEKGWSQHPRHRTQGELWHGRWKSNQPHPSFDIDGDGVISNLDYYLAKRFDKDNNGVLDQSEVQKMRTVLAKKGIESFHAMGHGPHIEKLYNEVHQNLMRGSPRAADPTAGLDPHAPEWHLKMANLTNKTRTAAHHNSENIAACIAHTDMDAGNATVMDSLMSKGVHQMMGSGWRDQESHEDVFDAEAGGWVDRKVGPKEVRDQDQDYGFDDDGKRVNRNNPFSHGELDDEKVLNRGHHHHGSHSNRGTDSARSDAPVPKAGKLSNPDPKSLRRLFEQMDTDKSGTLDRKEVQMMAAAGGKKLTKRQLHDAMNEMDKDGSGSIDYAEFEKWWTHGTVRPAAGTEVFRRISNQLECKFSNFRKVFRQFDENKDGTLSHHEFRKGLSNCGIELSEPEFKDLMLTLDEDNSNEIDYIEFATSGVAGGKYFAARDPKGFSGFNTKSMLLDKRKRVARAFGQSKMDAFWERTLQEPAISIMAITQAGGSGV